MISADIQTSFILYTETDNYDLHSLSLLVIKICNVEGYGGRC